VRLFNLQGRLHRLGLGIVSNVDALPTLIVFVFASFVMQTLDDPFDPLLAKMRADGTLLPPQYCNGTLLRASLVEEPVVRETGPLFLASTTPDFLRALNQTLNLSQLEDSAQVSNTLLIMQCSRQQVVPQRYN
jgi:hypothetical protein